MRNLLLAVWILLFAGAASADWDEVVDALERASGPEYDIGADPGESEWVATRKAGMEGERARMRSADFKSEITRERDSCRTPTREGRVSRCE